MTVKLRGIFNSSSVNSSCCSYPSSQFNSPCPALDSTLKSKDGRDLPLELLLFVIGYSLLDKIVSLSYGERGTRRAIHPSTETPVGSFLLSCGPSRMCYSIYDISKGFLFEDTKDNWRLCFYRRYQFASAPSRSNVIHGMLQRQTYW